MYLKSLADAKPCENRNSKKIQMNLIRMVQTTWPMSWKPVGSFIPNTSSSFSLTSHSWTDSKTWRLKLCMSPLWIIYFYEKIKQTMFCLRRNIHTIYKRSYTIFNVLRSTHERPRLPSEAGKRKTEPSTEHLLLCDVTKCTATSKKRAVITFPAGCSDNLCDHPAVLYLSCSQTWSLAGI